HDEVFDTIGIKSIAADVDVPLGISRDRVGARTLARGNLVIINGAPFPNEGGDRLPFHLGGLLHLLSPAHNPMMSISSVSPTADVDSARRVRDNAKGFGKSAGRGGYVIGNRPGGAPISAAADDPVLFPSAEIEGSARDKDVSRRRDCHAECASTSPVPPGLEGVNRLPRSQRAAAAPTNSPVTVSFT